MKTKQSFLSLTIVVMLFAMGSFLVSCNKSADPIASDLVQTASSEAATSSQTSETDDMANNALSKADPAARVAVFSDDRFACATITYDTASFKTKGSGKITIDFGTGCTDGKGNTRAGKMIVSWTGGRWFNAGSVHTITFLGYIINGVKFSDVDSRVITNISTLDSPLTWTVEATHNLTWPDNSTATRTVHETRQWVRSQNIVDDKFIVSQTANAAFAATGTNRHGKSYNMQITVPLEYDRSCAISNKVFRPVKGTKVITFDTNKEVTIDFGDGTCDRTFTITVNGHTRTINASNDASN